MSISSAVRKAGPYTGNGSTTAFPFAFKVFAASDLLVVRTDLSAIESPLTFGTDYTVSLNANQDANPGGTITALVAPATGYLITITSAVQNLQPVGLTNQGGFYPKVINDALDRATIQIQQVAEQVGRAIKVGISSTLTPDQLITQLNANVTAAQASATAADASANAADTSEANAGASAAAAAASAGSIALPLPLASGGTGATTAPTARAALGLGSLSTLNSVDATNLAAGVLDPSLFYKVDAFSPAFIKTAAATLSIKAGASAMVAGVKVAWAVDTVVVMPALTGGIDYAVYVCTDGSIRADASTAYPTGYNAGNSRKIGGFHYGLVASGTTVASGSFNTAGSPVGGGMVWTQGDVDKIAGINQWSIWDLKFRPACADPRGMVLVNGRTWVDIYLCNTDTAANGTSKAGSNIASGTVLPKVPVPFGGNGTLTYSTLTWWEASELARANQKRLLLASEFYDAAFGVTENQSIDATASTYPTTQRNAGYTSKYGIEQASGHHYVWGQDSAGSASAWVANGGRGQSYNNSVYRVLLGGSRAGGAPSGSRCSSWSSGASSSYWYGGLRAACDHMSLV